jgi:putative FmdB family regulatory protein
MIGLMPVYEFHCPACGRKAARLLSIREAAEPQACPSGCAGEMEKLVSRFRRGRGESARMDEIAARIESMDEPGSAAEMRDLVREIGQAADDDLSPELEEMLEADLEADAPLPD